MDPWRLEGRERLPRAALILVTHAHFDHASPESVAAVAGPETLIAGPADALARLPGARKRAVAAGDAFEEQGARVRVFPASDRPGGFHPPGSGVAYLVEGAGPRLLLAGDSASIPAIAPPPDILALPVCGETLPDPEEAARLAAGSGASAALPIHWGDLQGGYEEAARFRDALARLAPGIRTILRGVPRRAR